MPAAELNSQQLGALRELLEARRNELESQLASGDEATRPVTLDQQSVGRVSRIDAIQQQQMAIASQQQATRVLRRIELSLQRIESGEYGLCLQCAEPIGFARLEAQPFTSLCLDCQSASETG